ncbi:MAG: Peptidase, M50 family [Candidatus Curtissbacteria bacterium GW2011_GWA1_41_11]|uniref:Peptidase, M50 family n=1 Tax=Candidatus Curtissbacteria bacterium GW2011_GWA1_41_11 TaxID=1618409 RepID=A0A0G0XJT9_9BACT|nr:MAG: Peptidase, M50 family [Candidatus Curtissbacteria bacterium GW2011_GWA1_41_11]
MLINALLQGNPITALTFVIGLVVAISIHEAAHAFVAYRLGDPTAKLAGRLTLDPRSHLDPIGTLALLLVGFGWGKPTPFDPFNLRNVKRDSALISAAGAVSNFILASVLSLPYLVAFFTNSINLTIVNLYQFLSPIILINLLLGVFNLIPVHPLDGFKVLAGLLPRDWYRDFVQTERYGIFILLLLLVSGAISKILFPIVSYLFNILMPHFASPL